jgi:hypothetical protein
VCGRTGACFGGRVDARQTQRTPEGAGRRSSSASYRRAGRRQDSTATHGAPHLAGPFGPYRRHQRPGAGGIRAWTESSRGPSAGRHRRGTRCQRCLVFCPVRRLGIQRLSAGQIDGLLLGQGSAASRLRRGGEFNEGRPQITFARGNRSAMLSFTCEGFGAPVTWPKCGCWMPGCASPRNWGDDRPQGPRRPLLQREGSPVPEGDRSLQQGRLPDERRRSAPRMLGS